MTELHHPAWQEWGVIRQRIIDNQNTLKKVLAHYNEILSLVQDVINKGKGGKGRTVSGVADICRPTGLSSPCPPVSEPLSVGQAASMIGVEKRTIQDWCARGGLKNFASKRGRCWRIEQEPFIRYAYENGFSLKPSK